MPPGLPVPGDPAHPYRFLLAVPVALVVFGVLLVLVQAGWSPLRTIDDAVRDGAHRTALAHHGLVTMSLGLSRIGTTGAYVVLLVPVVVVLALLRRGWPVALVVAAVLGSPSLNNAVKNLLGRHRPVVVDPVAHAGGFSFPSGHAQAAAVAYLALLLVVWPYVHGALRAVAVGVAVVLPLAIGAARVLLSVHWLSDVVAGWALGVAWTLVVAALLRLVRRAVVRTEVR